MILAQNTSTKKIWLMLEQVTDPEIPVISIVDLGIVRNILLHAHLTTIANIEKGTAVEIIITPTYSGCPAIDVISIDIKMMLLQNGISQVKITQQLSPAWTTDWISEAGKQKLKAYGIAPPQSSADNLQFNRLKNLFAEEELNIECPQCHSTDTKLLSQFGSTACKALYQCNNCKEPFDYFKCH
jgi:ring-1,2-phenylacetyl-CoA epoxidase subunit PaaD